MREQVENFLRERFPGMEVDLGPVEHGSPRISGVLIWNGFANMDVAEQQACVWDALRERFGVETVNISTLLTFTPDEAEALRPESWPA